MSDENISGPLNLAKNSAVDIGTVEESLPQSNIVTTNIFKIPSCKKVDIIENEASKFGAFLSSNDPEKKPNEQLEEDRPSKPDINEAMMTPGKKKLHSWLNEQMKIEMTDGRVLVGIFLCTDRDANVILGSCTEYLNPEVCGFTDEPRILGLVMVPGRHIVSIHHDDCDAQFSNIANMVMPENRDFQDSDVSTTEALA